MTRSLLSEVIYLLSEVIYALSDIRRGHPRVQPPGDLNPVTTHIKYHPHQPGECLLTKVLRKQDVGPINKPRRGAQSLNRKAGTATSWGGVGNRKLLRAGEAVNHHRLLWTFVLIPLIIVVATKSPQFAGDVITVGAKLLNGVANVLGDIANALSRKH